MIKLIENTENKTIVHQEHTCKLEGFRVNKDICPACSPAKYIRAKQKSEVAEQKKTKEIEKQKKRENVREFKKKKYVKEQKIKDDFFNLLPTNEKEYKEFWKGYKSKMNIVSRNNPTTNKTPLHGEQALPVFKKRG